MRLFVAFGFMALLCGELVIIDSQGNRDSVARKDEQLIAANKQLVQSYVKVDNEVRAANDALKEENRSLQVRIAGLDKANENLTIENFKYRVQELNEERWRAM